MKEYTVDFLELKESKSWQTAKRGRPYDFEPIEELVTVDEVYECSRCKCSVGDVAARSIREQLIMVCCWDCGQAEWLPGRLNMPELIASAVMSSGRFAGLTIQEAYAKPNGEKYLRWLADHGDPMSDQIKLFFSNLAT